MRPRARSASLAASSTHDSRTRPSGPVIRNVTASNPAGAVPGGSVATVPVTMGTSGEPDVPAPADDEEGDGETDDGETDEDPPPDEHPVAPTSNTTSATTPTSPPPPGNRRQIAR